jgi:hypothetical protein
MILYCTHTLTINSFCTISFDLGVTPRWYILIIIIKKKKKKRKKVFDPGVKTFTGSEIQRRSWVHLCWTESDFEGCWRTARQSLGLHLNLTHGQSFRIAYSIHLEWQSSTSLGLDSSPPKTTLKFWLVALELFLRVQHRWTKLRRCKIKKIY